MDIPHTLYLYNHQDLYAFGELVIVAFSNNHEKGFVNNVIEMLADLGAWYKEKGVLVSPHTFMSTYRAADMQDVVMYASKLAVRALGTGRPFTTTQCAQCIKTCIGQDTHTDILANITRTRRRSTEPSTRNTEALQQMVRKEWSAMFYKRDCPRVVTLYANPGPHTYIRTYPTTCQEPALVMELCTRIPKVLCVMPRSRTAVEMQRTLCDTRRVRSEPVLFSII